MKHANRVEIASVVIDGDKVADGQGAKHIARQVIDDVIEIDKAPVLKENAKLI